MKINHNITAMLTYRRMGANQRSESKAMGRLSSGFRINNAGEDAAGLGISEKMRGQIRGLNQAARNVQDSISLLQTAEGALKEIHSILQRVRELSVQAVNNTNNDQDCAKLQEEASSLISEINYISKATEYNTQKLLNGDLKSSFQIGSNVGQTEVISIEDMSAVSLGIETSKISFAAKHGEVTVAADFISESAFVEGDQTYKIKSLGETKELNYSWWDGKKYEYVMYDADSGDIVAVSPKDDGERISWAVLKEATGVAGLDSAEIYTDWNFTFDPVALGEISFNLSYYNAWGANTFSNVYAGIEVDGKNLAEGNYKIVTDKNEFAGLLAGFDPAVDFLGTDFADLEGILTDGNGQAAALAIDGGWENNYLFGWFSVEDINFSAGGTASIDALVNGGFDDALFTHRSYINAPAYWLGEIANNTAAKLEIEAIDITKESSISVINSAIEKVSAERSKLGALEDRLVHTFKNLATSAENLQTAESHIRDVDMSSEVIGLTKTNILQQAATAMLAQANQAPQSVLQLLG